MVGQFPASSHAPITYPIAVLRAVNGVADVAIAGDGSAAAVVTGAAGGLGRVLDGRQRRTVHEFYCLGVGGRKGLAVRG